NSRVVASLCRSWITVAPPAMASAATAARSRPPAKRGSTMTYRRRSTTADHPQDLEGVARAQHDLGEPLAFDNLAIVLDRHRAGLDAVVGQETEQRRLRRQLAGLAVNLQV